MDNNYCGIEKVYNKGRFMFEVHIDGKCETTRMTYDAALKAFEEKMKIKTSKADGFIEELKRLLGEYSAVIRTVDNSVFIGFDDDVTAPIIIDGDKLDSKVLQTYKTL